MISQDEVNELVLLIDYKIISYFLFRINHAQTHSCILVDCRLFTKVVWSVKTIQSPIITLIASISFCTNPESLNKCLSELNRVMQMNWSERTKDNQMGCFVALLCSAIKRYCSLSFKTYSIAPEQPNSLSTK